MHVSQLWTTNLAAVQTSCSFTLPTSCSTQKTVTEAFYPSLRKKSYMHSLRWLNMSIRYFNGNMEQPVLASRPLAAFHWINVSQRRHGHGFVNIPLKNPWPDTVASWLSFARMNLVYLRTYWQTSAVVLWKITTFLPARGQTFTEHFGLKTQFVPWPNWIVGRMLIHSQRSHNQVLPTCIPLTTTILS